MIQAKLSKVASLSYFTSEGYDGTFCKTGIPASDGFVTVNPVTSGSKGPTVQWDIPVRIDVEAEVTLVPIGALGPEVED